MTGGYYILEGHEPVPTSDVSAWGKMMQGRERIVAQDSFGEIRVSTVFLGLDHNFHWGEPLIFETMIFGGKCDQYQERYSTWDEAVEGHAKAVALAKAEGKA